MKLTNMQFCRVAAFFGGLRLINETIGAETPMPKTAKGRDGIERDPIKALQEFTVERSNRFAIELGVSFPDETERETPESLAEYDRELMIARATDTDVIAD